MKEPRGTYDLYGTDMLVHRNIIKLIEEVVTRHNFSEIKTPIFESTELFQRSSGESSDVVQKEMYTFLDKSDRSMTLRPELTAGVLRAFLTNKLFGERLSQYKYYYYGEAFRYERPQSGRYRQFHQFGVEFYGESNIYSDVEVIFMACDIFKKLKIYDKVKLKINTIGQLEDRKKYNKILQEYFESKSGLCEDCMNRLKTNPLRILDCKIDSQKDIVKNAPKLKTSINSESLKNYEEILQSLTELNIIFEEEDSLVRGLDYYNDIVFEFVYEDQTLIGGGRYDKLIEEFSTHKIPAIGFGIGLERIIMAYKKENLDWKEENKENVDFFYMILDSSKIKEATYSAFKIKQNGIKSYISYNMKSFKSQMKLAQNLDAVYVIIFDEQEKINIKNMITKEEKRVNLIDFENDVLEGE